MTPALTTAHAAQLLACSDDHVRDLIRAGRLRAFRVGRRLRVYAGEVERYVESTTIGNTRPPRKRGPKTY